MNGGPRGFVIGIVLLVAVSTVWAQVVPPKVQAGAVEQQMKKPAPEPSPGSMPKIVKPPRPAMELAGTAKIKVEKFIITGNTRISTEKLLKEIAKFTKQELTLAQLKEVADIITQKYWDQGYITSFAYIPQQKVEKGVVEIAVIEGRVGQVKVEKNRYYTTRFIERHFAAVKNEPVLKQSTLDRALLLLNDYPKMDASATLTKGRDNATTDIYVSAPEKFFPINLSVNANNFGSRYTGKNRFGFDFDLGNLTRNGDVFSVSLTLSPRSTENMLFGKASYTLPLNGYGTKANISYSHMEYDVGKELALLGVEGEGRVLGLTLSHPLVRQRTQNFYLSGGLKVKRYKNYMFEKTVLTSRDKYSTLELGVNADRSCGNVYSSAALGLTAGLGEFLGAMSDDEYTSSSRPGLANSTWVK
ncbi:MAG TPA: ShlB/FhaC/HecB family hemolysin secretion/activation protein, partial [bacterium]|nr:ShlB/FhaC/HecB family hemolysin secretion/activation protein [bacterium]